MFNTDVYKRQAYNGSVFLEACAICGHKGEAETLGLTVARANKMCPLGSDYTSAAERRALLSVKFTLYINPL